MKGSLRPAPASWANKVAPKASLPKHPSAPAPAPVNEDTVADFDEGDPSPDVSPINSPLSTPVNVLPDYEDIESQDTDREKRELEELQRQHQLQKKSPNSNTVGRLHPFPGSKRPAEGDSTAAGGVGQKKAVTEPAMLEGMDIEQNASQKSAEDRKRKRDARSSTPGVLKLLSPSPAGYAATNGGGGGGGKNEASEKEGTKGSSPAKKARNGPEQTAVAKGARLTSASHGSSKERSSNNKNNNGDDSDTLATAAANSNSHNNTKPTIKTTPPPLPKKTSFGTSKRKAEGQAASSPKVGEPTEPKIEHIVLEDEDEDEQSRLHNHQQQDEDPELEGMVKEILGMPMYTAPDHLVCPLTHKIMNDPVFAEDGYTYEKQALVDWIRQQTADADGYVPGPSGDQISPSHLQPNKFIRLAVERWRRKRKALKKTLKMGRNEPATARRLRTSLDELRAVELRNFEKAQMLGQIREKLRVARDKEEKMHEAADERETRIAEIEEKLRELTRELEELRAVNPSDKGQLDGLKQESIALRQAGAMLGEEAAEARAELLKVWQENLAHRQHLEDLRKVGDEIENVFEEMGDFAKSLRQKREKSMKGIVQLRKDIQDVQEQLAQELCRNARLLEEEDPHRPEMLAHASDLGSVEARYLLGKHYGKALPLFLRVIESGLGDNNIWVLKSNYYAGLCHRNGVGTPVNKELALQYFLKASEQGLPRAQNIVGNVYNEVGGVVERNVELAFTYFQKAAAGGDKMAMYNLAILYQSDEVSAKDEAHAFHMFKDLAEQNDPDSMYEVSLCYQHGRGVAMDQEKGRYWRQKAVDHGFDLSKVQDAM